MHSHNPHPDMQSLALMTDFYQLTMAYGFYKSNLCERESVFHLFFRTLPFHGGYALTAGLENVIQYLNNFQFKENDIDYLRSLKNEINEPIFEEEFFEYLLNMKFSCDVDGVPEGTVIFPYEPLLRITGPLIQCQILETALLNLVNFPTLIATKASRLSFAAKGDPILEFGIRRAQGMDGALTASRSAYIGGCDSTSNLLAGKLFGIPVRGTHSHSWVMVFDEELEAFDTYAKYLPRNCVFLVDTYNTLEGVRKAIIVGKRLREQGYELVGIRLDSGDLAYLSIESRKLLDDAGFQKAKIIASNELDELVISELKQQGAAIAIWGVGTNLVTAKDQPAIDGVYKLSAIRNDRGEWNYKIKLSEQMKKISNPGILQVRRYYDQNGPIGDAIYDINSKLDNGCFIIHPFDPTHTKFFSKDLDFQDLLIPIFRKGKCIYQLPTIHEIREKAKKEIAKFPSSIKRFLNPYQYPVGMEESLYHLKIELVKKIRTKMSKKERN